MSFSTQNPVFGWAMNFTPTGNPYVNQHNIIGGPSSPLEQQKLEQDCHIKQRDGKYSNEPPFYQLEPTPFVNCPYYNYTLPNVYPEDEDKSEPNPLQYWYYPYYKNPNFWKNPIIRVPKPGY